MRRFEFLRYASFAVWPTYKTLTKESHVSHTENGIRFLDEFWQIKTIVSPRQLHESLANLFRL